MLSGTFGYEDISKLVALYSKERKKKQEAATVIQKNWRGFFVRNHFSKPLINHTAVDDRDPALPVGNDPISHLERLVTPIKHPAILATGGVQCLYNAIKLTAKEDGQLGEKPKIFLMDHNPDVISFWKLLQRSFRESESVESFLEKLPRYVDEVHSTNDVWYIAPYPLELTEEERFSQWLIGGGASYEVQRAYLEMDFPELNVDNYHPIGLYAFFSRLLKGDQNRFNWIKSTVTNQMHLMLNCWVKSTESFQFIKRVCQHHDYEVFVYASNILDSITDGEEVLQNNVNILEPTVIVVTNTLCRADDKGFPMSTDYLVHS